MSAETQIQHINPENSGTNQEVGEELHRDLGATVLKMTDLLIVNGLAADNPEANGEMREHILSRDNESPSYEPNEPGVEHSIRGFHNTSPGETTSSSSNKGVKFVERDSNGQLAEMHEYAIHDQHSKPGNTEEVSGQTGIRSGEGSGADSAGVQYIVEGDKVSAVRHVVDSSGKHRTIKPIVLSGENAERAKSIIAKRVARTGESLVEKAVEVQSETRQIEAITEHVNEEAELRVAEAVNIVEGSKKRPEMGYSYWHGMTNSEMSQLMPDALEGVDKETALQEILSGPLSDIIEEAYFVNPDAEFKSSSYNAIREALPKIAQNAPELFAEITDVLAARAKDLSKVFSIRQLTDKYVKVPDDTAEEGAIFIKPTVNETWVQLELMGFSRPENWEELGRSGVTTFVKSLARKPLDDFREPTEEDARTREVMAKIANNIHFRRASAKTMSSKKPPVKNTSSPSRTEQIAA